MRISDWSSDVCSSDLPFLAPRIGDGQLIARDMKRRALPSVGGLDLDQLLAPVRLKATDIEAKTIAILHRCPADFVREIVAARGRRSEEHTSELPSLMRTTYAVFCLKKKHIPARFTPTSTITSQHDTIN